MALEEENRLLRDEIKKLKERIAELLAEIERLKKIIADLLARLEEREKQEQAEKAREEMELRRREEEARYVGVWHGCVCACGNLYTVHHESISVRCLDAATSRCLIALDLSHSVDHCMQSRSNHQTQQCRAGRSDRLRALPQLLLARYWCEECVDPGATVISVAHVLGCPCVPR